MNMRLVFIVYLLNGAETKLKSFVGKQANACGFVLAADTNDPALVPDSLFHICVFPSAPCDFSFCVLLHFDFHRLCFCSHSFSHMEQ